MGEWRKMKLREANIMLIDCDHRTPPGADVGYPYVAIPQLRSGRIDLSDVRRITREHFLEWTRKAMPSADDVILSRRCNPGETAVVPPQLEFALGQNLVLLRADGTKVYPPFLRWLTRGPEWWVQINKFINVGAFFDSLRCADVPNFEFYIPPLPTQKAISHILGTLDDKIELKRKMSESLEQIAQALFKSWFVDFDPVRAKMEGRDTGLPKEIADLFPDSFEESELGEIPKGWKVGPIEDFIERLSVGKKYEQKTVCLSGATPVLDQGKTGVIGYHDDAPGVVASDERPVIVFANHTCYMWLVSFSFSAIQNVFPFIGDGVDTIWMFYATYGKQSFVEYKGHWPDFILHRIIVPDFNLTAIYSRTIFPFLKTIWLWERESKILANFRDTLLPKLMSREIEVQ